MIEKLQYAKDNELLHNFLDFFINSTHETGDCYQRAGKGYALPIKIEDGYWIGANTTIMPGVTIAKGCIIAANSLVTKDTEPNGLYVGQPAKRVKDYH